MKPIKIEVPDNEIEIENDGIEIDLQNHTVSQKLIPGPQGEKGEDGYTPTAEEIMAIVEPSIPKEQDIIKKVISKIPKPKDGKDGKNGKDGKDGAKGEKGDPIKFEDLTIAQKAELEGPRGVPGLAGPGVPKGGATGYILAKSDAQDYHTEWIPNSGGGGGAVNSVNGQTGVVVLDQDDIGDGTTYKQYSATEKTKLAGIETGAEVNTIDTVSDTTEIDLAITARDLTATIRSGSIDESKLDTSVNASLDLADSALQTVAVDGVTITGDGTVGNPLVASGGGSGTVTSVAVSGSDGIEIDSGSPITTSGTIALGINKTTLLSHINVEDGAEVNNISDTNATDLTDGGDTTLHTHDGRYYTESETDTLLGNKLDTSLKGANNGLAELDAGGKVPSAQLPSYVDDVIEVANFAALPGTGETGKIYITLDTNLTYRWSGSAYVEISVSLALGETSSTAYRGDRGKTAYDHSQLTSGNPHNVTKSDVGLGNVDNTSDATKNSASVALTNKDLTSGTNTFPTFNQNTTGSAATLTTPRAIYGNNFDGSAALTQVIASTYGGTGNGWTKFTGPTTSEKTKTLRDATDTILELGGSYTPTGTWTNMTLVTPALGTPSALVLTNATGLPTAGLVDDAVTLAKMAAGTAGNLITYDASGNPAAIATGTAGQVLISNGPGAAPTMQTRGMYLKKTSSAMSSNTITVTDSDVTTTSGIVWNASATPNGFIQVTTASGSVTFTSTASETCSFTYYILN